VRIAPRRGDTRRFPPANRCACPFNGGLIAALLPRRNFVRQCSRVILADSPLKTELTGVLKGLNFGAHARQDRLEIRVRPIMPALTFGIIVNKKSRHMPGFFLGIIGRFGSIWGRFGSIWQHVGAVGSAVERFGSGFEGSFRHNWA